MRYVRGGGISADRAECSRNKNYPNEWACVVVIGEHDDTAREVRSYDVTVDGDTYEFRSDD